MSRRVMTATRRRQTTQQQQLRLMLLQMIMQLMAALQVRLQKLRGLLVAAAAKACCRH